MLRSLSCWRLGPPAPRAASLASRRATALRSTACLGRPPARRRCSARSRSWCSRRWMATKSPCLRTDRRAAVSACGGESGGGVPAALQTAPAAGKTHTMMGSPDDQGVIPRAMQQIFATAEELGKQGWRFVMRVAMVEVRGCLGARVAWCRGSAPPPRLPRPPIYPNPCADLQRGAQGPAGQGPPGRQEAHGACGGRAHGDGWATGAAISARPRCCCFCEPDRVSCSGCCADCARPRGRHLGEPPRVC